MKLVRYQWQQQLEYGAVVDGFVHRLEAGLRPSPPLGPPVATLDRVQLLAPCEPSKIIAVGLNYAAHASEHGFQAPEEPIFFLKPPSAVIGPGAAIVYPEHLSEHVEHESELAAVIGRRASRVSPAEALDYVLGFTCANDVTARDLQRRDGQWTRSKSFDTFCPLGPWIETDLDITDLQITCHVNGELRQSSRTSHMLFGVAELVARASAVMTLQPGDVILTGTPDGVNSLCVGDRVVVEIEGIGRLENKVVGRS